MREREFPQNISAEQSVVGAMMLSKDAVLTATEILRDEDCAIDLVIATERLRKDGCLEKVGGISFVAYIANCVPTAANIRCHAKIVKEMALLQRLVETDTEMICSSYDRRDEVEDILGKA